LLRSVAVAPSHRGLGFGQRLVQERLAFAKTKNLDAVYLLTTTAAPFFGRLGFEAVSRADAPAGVRESLEFSSVCPTSSACLVKNLVPAGNSVDVKSGRA
jgi:amino-acid N-acetyltransferase